MSSPRPESQPAQQQEPPGVLGEMTPKPDHGEESYQGSGKLTGKAAVITGGDSGIGRAVAIAFAREGADVLISYLPEEEDDARESARWVEEAGRRVVLVPGDIADQQHCREIVERAVSEFGKLDILVNNAAFQQHAASLEEITDEHLHETLETNIGGFFHMARAGLPHMEQGAGIINTSSVTGLFGSPKLLDYSATKGAINAFTMSLASNLIERGIRVNAVAPGPVWTPLIPMSFDPESTANFGADNPMGRPAQPAELAPLYVFLASAESSYIAGEVIGVTGGELR